MNGEPVTKKMATGATPKNNGTLGAIAREQIDMRRKRIS